VAESDGDEAGGLGGRQRAGAADGADAGREQRGGHDVAVLWSFTEAAMRQKAMAAKRPPRRMGEQIKLMIAALPENSALKNGKRCR